MIALTCVCGKNYTIADRAAGQRIKCPKCGSMMAIPGDPIDQVEPGDPPPRPTALPDPSADSEVLWRISNTLERIEGKVWWIHLVMVLPFLVALIAFILCAVFWILSGTGR